MARRVAIHVLAQLVPLALLVLAASAAPLVVRAGDPCFHDLTRPAVTDAVATDVTVAADCAFSPTIARVPVGATVTFTNTSFQAHEIVGANLAWGAALKPIAPGGTLSHKFDAAGIYPYSCMIHPGMTGAIVVGGSAAAAAGVNGVGGPSTDAAAAVDAAAVGATSDGDGAPAGSRTASSSVLGSLTGAALLAAAAGLAVILSITAWFFGRRRGRQAPSR